MGTKYNQLVSQVNNNYGYGLIPYETYFFGYKVDMTFIRWFYDFTIITIILIVALMIFLIIYWRWRDIQLYFMNNK